MLVELCADVLCPWGRGKARELHPQVILGLVWAVLSRK